MTTLTEFWMVYTPGSPLEHRTVVFPTEVEANAEAERRTKQEGRLSFVMKAVGVHFPGSSHTKLEAA